MKKIIVLAILFTCAGARAGVTLSNPAAVPTNNVAISQLDSSGSQNIQARQRGPGATDDWRAITSTFKWTSPEDFDGIGFFLGEGNDALWTAGSTQTYQFVIQAVEATGDNLPTETLLDATFELTGDKVADGQWLYIDTDNVSLQAGQWYGFSLAPQEGATDSTLRTYWDAANGDVYAGRARTYDPATGGGIPKTDGYAAGGGVNDYTLYMLHTPSAIVLSNPASLPTENVAILQSNHAGPEIQARNRIANMGDYRAITQTFTWNSLDAFDGIGLYLDSDNATYNNNAYWTSGDSQAFLFVIEALEVIPGSGWFPTQTVYQAEFALTGDKVADGQWLYIDTADVELQNGQIYGFSLSPATNDVNPSLRTYFKTADTDAYLPGLARTYNPGLGGIMPKTDSYDLGGSVNDYAFYLTHTPPVVLSNPAGVPAYNVAVSQLDSSGDVNVQARQRGPGPTDDWRAITETFQWTTTNAFDGIGLFMGSGNDALWSGTSTQTYQFVIQAVDSNNVPTSTVLNADFHLTGDKVADGQWLYIDTPDVNLESNKWYGFSLAPPAGATDSGLRTFWDTATGDVYAGLARQYDPASGGGIPKTDSYAAGGGGSDFTFYLVHAVARNGPATIVDFFPAFAGVMKMVIAVPGDLELYHPESSPSLAPVAWSVVAHSSDGTPGSFAITNLDYSTTSGDNVEIYVETEGSTGFFNIIGEPQ